MKIDPATLAILDDALYLARSMSLAGVHSPRVRPSISAPSSPTTPMPPKSSHMPDGPVMRITTSPGFAGTFPCGSVKYMTDLDRKSRTSKMIMAQSLPGRA